ncbi:hypothetical protein [Citrobacter freundii]|uniref:hypothetical protein n=1 Tax=Citrobacter freundii TaxID=546 RepID=UPI0022470E9E|nr:hypothetical protein [Citrobacter freundii]MCX2442343.1 hypothetical protein [Citrobacter freundii]MCX2470809.1 hypothetical protein [Citrobacter freundii]UZQ87638.1 hypothetical protein OQW59_15560 [Citrobacter freundii]UZQ93976.1 hypothetical protein OQY67_20010 [Citrobacter freundii]UZQ98481.1 hypothetical protein OQZ20_15690 [Citrobacter freundii]
MSKVSDAIDYLSARKKSVACMGKQGLRDLMADLGFKDTAGDTDNHRIFTHAALSDETEFKSTSVDCTHQQNKPMKLPYVVKIIGVLRTYRETFEEWERIENEKA